MASQDDLTLLKEMYQRGEISDEQYDVLRRHVLWGTPLPQLIDEVPAPRSAAPPAPGGYAPPGPSGSPPRAAPAPAGREAGASAYRPDDPLTAPWRPDTGFVPAQPPRSQPRVEPPAAYRPADRPAAGHRPVGEPAGYRPVDGPPPGYRPAGEPAGYRSPGGPPPGYHPADGPPSTQLPPAAPVEPSRRRRRADDEQPFPPSGNPLDPASEPSRRRRRADDEPPAPFPPSGAADQLGEPSRRRRRAEDEPPAPYQPPAGYRLDEGPPTAYRSPERPPATRADQPLMTPGEPSWAQRRSEDEPVAAFGLSAPHRPPAAYPSDPYAEEAYRGDGETPGLGRGAPTPRRRRDLADEPDDPRDVREVPAVPDRPQRPSARRGQKLVAVLTSLLLALALAAAGVWWFALRETGVDAAAYARSICGSVRDWQREVDASSSALVKAIPREEDRTKVRATVQRYYTDLATRTDGLRTAIAGAGPVDVPGGRAYADSLTAAVNDQSGSLRELAARAGRLDAAAATVFQISLQALLTGAETAVSEISAALARPAAGTPAALRAALSDEPACAPYVG